MRSPPLLDDLQPLAYHVAVVAHLSEFERDLWTWASSADAERDYVAQVRTSLLKECYRLDADAHGDLVNRCTRVAERLEIAAPITLYQAHGETAMNASLFYAPGEAHVVFSGAVLDRLQGAELDAVLAHELAHYRLWEQQNRAHLVADRLMLAAANDQRASVSHHQTAHRLRLYTEIYADRGAYIGCGDLHAAIAALVKMATGLSQVSGAAYLRQADELLAERGERATDHPEMYIRARALRLWTERDESLDAWLTQAIEGETTIGTLCLLGQRRVEALTRQVLAELLLPQWMQTPALVSHAKAFFPDFRPATQKDETLVAAVQAAAGDLQDYWCYLLLDFARADRDLEDLPLQHALRFAERFPWRERFETLAAKELRLTKRQVVRLAKEAPDALAKAEAQ
jgi:predicted SprT family Zn-dependent metalloprotease